MDRKSYPRFVRDLRKAWVPGQGVIAEMSSQDKDHRDVRVSGSCVDNQGLVLEIVKVWDGDDLRWTGAPGAEGLKDVLNGLGCCGARFYTARSTVDSTFRRCYKPKPTAMCAGCRNRKCDDAE